MTTRRTSFKQNLLIYSLFVIMFFFAVSSTITGAVMPELRKHYGMTMSQIGFMNVAQSVGSILVLLAGGMLADRFPKAATIAVLFSLFTVLTYLMGFMPPYVLLLACVLLLGVSGGYLNMLISAFIPDLAPEKTTTYMNIAHGFFSLGLLFGSAFGIFVKAKVSWNNVYISVGVLYTVVAALYLAVLLTGAGRRAASAAQGAGLLPKAAPKPEKQSFLRLAVSGPMVLLFLGNLFFMGQQLIITSFLTVYAASSFASASPILAGLPIIFYWIGVVTGRFTQSVLHRRVDTRRWLVAGALVSCALTLSGLLLGNAYYLMAVLLVSGALTGASFPSLLSMACGLYPGRAGPATSIVCLGGSAGGILLPLIVGAVSDGVKTDVLGLPAGNLGMVVIPAALLLAAGMMVALGGAARRHAPAVPASSAEG